MNEGACDPDGRFYCGSMGYQHQRGGGALWRLDPDRSAHLVLDQVTVSNGLDWSPDGARAYYNDTERHQVDVFDYDLAAGLTGRRRFELFITTSREGLEPGEDRLASSLFRVIPGVRGQPAREFAA